MFGFFIGLLVAEALSLAVTLAFGLTGGVAFLVGVALGLVCTTIAMVLLDA